MVACSGCLREPGSLNYSLNWTPLSIESSRVFSGLLWGLIVMEHRDLDSQAIAKNPQTEMLWSLIAPLPYQSHVTVVMRLFSLAPMDGGDGQSEQW